MSVFSVLGSIAKTVMKVGHIILPIINAFREASPEVDMALQTVEGVIEDGGTIADDFFDRNLGALEDTKEFFVDLGRLSDAGVNLTTYCIKASQEETPDVITPAEVERIGRMLLEMKEGVAALLENSEGLAVTVEGMK